MMVRVVISQGFLAELETESRGTLNMFSPWKFESKTVVNISNFKFKKFI